MLPPPAMLHDTEHTHSRRTFLHGPNLGVVTSYPLVGQSGTTVSNTVRTKQGTWFWGIHAASGLRLCSSGAVLRFPIGRLHFFIPTGVR